MRKPKKRIKVTNTKHNEVYIDVETNHLHQWWDEPCTPSSAAMNLVNSNLKDILDNVLWTPSMIDRDDMFTKSFEKESRTAFPDFDSNDPWFKEIKHLPANREACMYMDYSMPDDFDRTPKEFGLDEHLADKMFLYSDWEYLPLPEGKPNLISKYSRIPMAGDIIDVQKQYTHHEREIPTFIRMMKEIHNIFGGNK